MSYYDRINVSEEIDINKTRSSKESDICHYWYFPDKEFKFQQCLCNGCHDVLMMSIILNDLAILNISAADYCCVINGISKSAKKQNTVNEIINSSSPYINWVKKLQCLAILKLKNTNSVNTKAYFILIK